MSCNFNKVVLMGRMTRDPSLRTLNNNSKVVEFGLAINREFIVNEEKRSETCFVDCEAWGRRAEVINQYFSKGRPIFVEGRLTLHTWNKEDGSKGKKHIVRVLNFEFVDPKNGERDAASEASLENSGSTEEEYDTINA